MQSKNQPNAAQIRWRESVRDVGSIVSGLKPCEIHHVVGCSGKHNKQHIGHYWLLPLTKHEHEFLRRNLDEFSREKYGFSFVGSKDLEKLLFADLLTHFMEQDLPFSEDELDAIFEYHR